MMHRMRTTVTLEPDTVALLTKRMQQRGVSFKEAVNEAIRAGLTETGTDRPREPFRTRTAALGVPAINLDRAVGVAGDLEDEEIVRKARLGK